MEQPIRVVHIIGKWVGGGVESVIMNYYRNIDKSKVQFDFICDNDSTDIPYDEINKLGGRVILIPPYQKVFDYHKELKKVLESEKYKIVHSHINTLSVFSLFAAKRANVPVRIAHSHSTTNKKEIKKNLLKQILRPFSKLFANYYMCCSVDAGKWLFGSKVIRNNELFILNNAIDLDIFKFDKNKRIKVRKELNISENTLVVGHVGRFVEQKNHNFLIEIFNQIHKDNKDSLLILVGQGPLKKDIEQKVLMLGLKENVLFLGQRKDVNDLYQAFDSFIIPSIYEGLGMVLVEAQVAGCRCVASDCIPKAASLSNNVQFLPVNQNLELWAKMAEIKYDDRNDKVKEARNNGYDIKLEAHKLLEKYYYFLKVSDKK